MGEQDDRVATGTKIEARFVPFPSSISEQARASLAFYVGPDGVALPRAPLPSRDDLAAWAAWRETVAPRNLAMLEAQAGTAEAASETVEIDGVVVHIAQPTALKSEAYAYLNIHGGALIQGGGEYCRQEGRLAADQHSVRTYSVDYRMPPEHPFPASLDDCMAVYRSLLERHRPENIIVGGRSAGGNLAAALALRARDEGLPLPAALVLLTPEVDLTESGDSFEVNRLVDVVLIGGLTAANALYASGHDLSHPYLSPLFGDFTKGFPPTFLQAGTRDLFLSNAVRMHRALRRSGVPVELHVFEGMPHGGFRGAAEDRELAEEISSFVREHWGRTQATGA